jgi:hypothetical protein
MGYRRHVALAMLLGCLASGVSAHHGWSGNSAGEVEITGVLVTPVSLSGPHGTMQIRDSEGNVWDITLAPGPRTHRAGLRQNTVTVGETVTVQGERNEDPERFEAKVRRVIWNDKEFDVYPPQ